MRDGTAVRSCELPAQSEQSANDNLVEWEFLNWLNDRRDSHGAQTQEGQLIAGTYNPQSNPQYYEPLDPSTCFERLIQCRKLC